MTVSKNQKGLWDVQFYYVDWQGKRVKKHKRNFSTKRDAKEWANQFITQQSKDLNMDFESFVNLYWNDMEQRLRESTMQSKKYIVDKKILPYFGKKKISEITAADVRMW